jgi:hypothetical protein
MKKRIRLVYDNEHTNVKFLILLKSDTPDNLYKYNIFAPIMPVVGYVVQGYLIGGEQILINIDISGNNKF